MLHVASLIEIVTQRELPPLQHCNEANENGFLQKKKIHAIIIFLIIHLFEKMFKKKSSLNVIQVVFDSRVNAVEF